MVSTNTLVVFDWDDTLFPTTQLKKGDLSSSPDVSTLVQSVYQLLATGIIAYGASNVYIVTNGSDQWVLQSLKLLNDLTNQSIPWMEYLRHLIIQKRVIVISARSRYASTYPNRPHIWKRMVYNHLLTQHFVLSHNSDNPSAYRFLCVSNSDVGHAESRKVVQSIHNTLGINILLHRIRLKDKPELFYMLNQLRLVQVVLSFMDREQSSIVINYDDERTRRCS